MGQPSSGMTRVYRPGSGWGQMPASQAPQEVQDVLAAYSPGGTFPGYGGNGGGAPDPTMGKGPPNLSSTWGVPDSAWNGSGVGTPQGPAGLIQWLMSKYGG